MPKNKSTLSFLLAGFALVASHTVWAADPGDLDNSFGGGGIVTTSFPGASRSAINMVKQRTTDAKLVTAGYQLDGSSVSAMTAARYNGDGSPDTAFSGDGLRAIVFPIGRSYGWSTANAPNNKLVVVGSVSNGSNYDFALARLDDSGALDTTFGTNGLVNTAVGSSNEEALDVIVHSDGRLKVVGYSNSGTNYNDFAIAAYTATGLLDKTFASIGKATTDMGGDDVAFSVLQQPDNKLVLGGYSESMTTGTKSFAIARYTTTGALDTSFSGDGKVLTVFGNDSAEIRDIVRQSDGKLVAVGCAGGDIALARYTASGALDTGFGTGGLVKADFFGWTGCGSSVIQQFDGKLLVAGYAYTGASSSVFALVRYTSNGVLDSSFGTGGKLFTTIGVAAGAYAAVEQVDGQVVAAGVSDTQMALVRYLFDDDDNDGITDSLDNCQYVPNADQANNDFAYEPLTAKVGDACDDDDDNDGVKDVDDAFPFDPTESVDTDSDGIGNNADPDDDNDGVPDVDDPFPLDPFLLNRVTGDSKTDYAGYSVAIVGDVNADGFADILVGTPKNDVILPPATKAALDVGTAYLVSGAMPGGVQVILETLDGAAKGDEFGSVVAAVGDVNHDTVPDFAIAAPKADQLDPITGKVLVKDRGAVTVYSGADFSELFTLDGEAAGDGFGISVAAAGDVDADTYGDIVVGAWKADIVDPVTLKSLNDAGAAYLYSGQTGNLLHKFAGETKGDYFGYSVSAGSDLDHDAVSEVSIGAYKHDPLDGITGKPRTDAGSVYVYSSASPYTLVKRLDGAAKSDNFGFAQVAINNGQDAFADLLVGSPRADVITSKKYADAGQVSLFTDTTGVPTYTLHAATPQAGALFGNALAAAGDVNAADGEDFIVGAPKMDITPLSGKKLTDAGQISAHNANSGSSVFVIDGDIKAGQFGFAVAGGGDHNNDGYDDVMTGAPYAAFNGKTKAGVAKVISGKEASEAAAP